VTRPRDELIRQLVDELTPAPRLASARVAASIWLAACLSLVALATLSTGSLRPGVARQLVSEPGFGMDLLLGVCAAAAAILGLMRLRIPGLVFAWSAAAPALALGLAWAAWQLLEGSAETGPPSMLGKREGCSFEILLFSLLPLAAALVVARRAAPLERAWTGLLAGLAAGALPALAMQLACLDDPLHQLTRHLAPVLVMAGMGALLGRLALRRF
jgi:hypothetical protein